MAVPRPWTTPEELKAYSELKEVQERKDDKLKFDISRAEMKIISITNNRFDGEEVTELPEPVKMATILVAEAYAKNAVEAGKKKIKSETFDDYSYTAESGLIEIESLDLAGLLDDYVIEKGSGKIVMKLRKL